MHKKYLKYYKSCKALHTVNYKDKSGKNKTMGWCCKYSTKIYKATSPCKQQNGRDYG